MAPKSVAISCRMGRATPHQSILDQMPPTMSALVNTAALKPFSSTTIDLCLHGINNSTITNASTLVP